MHEKKKKKKPNLLLKPAIKYDFSLYLFAALLLFAFDYLLLLRFYLFVLFNKRRKLFKNRIESLQFKLKIETTLGSGRRLRGDGVTEMQPHRLTAERGMNRAMSAQPNAS